MRAGDDPDLSPVPGGLRVHEARERARLLTVENYDVRLDFSESPRSARFESHTRVTFSSSVAVASSWIDLIAADVVHVELNGVVLDPRRVVKPGRVLLDGLATRNVLVVRAVHFAAEGRAVGRGLSRSVDPNDGAVYLWSQCEAFDARRIFACFDQPDLKATIRLTVTAPPDWSCVSNGTATVTDGENRTWRFSPTPPLPTYVFAICAGPFCRVAATDPGVPIRLYARRSLAPYLQAEAVELLATTRRGLAYYEAEFGVPYPGDSYDYVFLPDFGGAMENLGCVCWTDEVIYRDPPTPLERHLRMIILLHEMAHMWFGNLVTMRWWDGLWLNESFADWAGFGAAASLDSDIDGWATFLHLRKRLGYRADQAPTTHAVSGFVADVAHAEAIVDMITYAKGASVLRQLTALVGEAAFREALRQYFRKLAWRNAELGDLLSEVEAAAGVDLKAWAHDWLETSGTSTLVLDVEKHDRGYRTVTVRQRSGAGFPDLREHRLNLGVYDRDGAGRLTRRQRVAVHVATASGAVDELSGGPLAELLLPNDDDLDFVKIRVDERSLPALMHPERLPDARARAVALGVLDDMMRDGELPASIVLAAISGCLEVEDSPVQVQLLLALADELATLWTPAGYRSEAMAGLAEVCRRRLDATPESGPLARVHRLGFVQLSATPDQLDLVARMLARETHDQAFRWTCLERLTSAARVSDTDIDAEAGRDPDPDAVVKARIVRSARGTRAAKDRGIALMFGNEPLSRTQRRHLSKAFWQPLQARLLPAYLESYLQRMWQRLEGGDDDALHIAVVEFPVHWGAPALADLRRLAADTRVPARSRKTLLDHLDLIERARRAHSLAAGRSTGRT